MSHVISVECMCDSVGRNSMQHSVCVMYSSMVRGGCFLTKELEYPLFFHNPAELSQATVHPSFPYLNSQLSENR